MPSSFRVDHIVILVDELDTAIADFRNLGFAVTPGGQHPSWGSRNALVGLADGAYLELIAFDGRLADGRYEAKESLADQLADEDRSPVECRVLAWQAPAEGLVDFALLPADTQRDITQARQHGLDMEGPLPGSRTRPDGQTVRWQLGIPSTFDVPFLCGDVTDRSLRIPPGEATHHANGVTGIERLLVAVADLDDSILRYRALLGTTPQDVPQEWPQMRTAAFGIGSTHVVLAAPAGPVSPIWGILTGRGQGPFSLYLRTIHPNLAGPLDLVHSHNTHINLVAEPR